MAYRRRYRSRARTYRRYRRAGFSRARRSAMMQFAGMSQQRDLARFCLKYRTTAQLEIATGASSQSGYINMMAVLAQTPQYTYLSGIFDEVKINAIRLKMVPTWQVSQSETQRVTQITAWDRSGVNSSVNPPTYEEICSYGSSYKQAATAFSKNSVSSSIVATDLSERTIYIPTKVVPNASTYETYYARAWNPAFLFGVQLPAQAAAKLTYKYEFEIAFDLTFRGTRYDDTAQ